MTGTSQDSNETARLAEVGARFLAGKSLAELTAGLSAATAAQLTDVLADAGRLIEDSARTSAKTSS